MRSDGASWRDGDTDVEHKNAAYEGQLVRPQIDRLSEHLAASTTTPDVLWMLVWHGYGGSPFEALGHRKLEISRSLTQSARSYYLCRGSFEEVDLTRDGPAFTEPPSFWWPEDRAWFVSTDIDLPCTNVGGTPSLVQSIADDGELEAFPAALEDPVAGDPLPDA